MKSRPQGVTDEVVRAALADGWGLPGSQLRYSPVGAGSYHWTNRRLFVTVDDLDTKPWLGSSHDQAFAGLRAAMDTARALARLPFVLAPIPASSGGTVERLGEHYAVTVFPYLDGAAGEWGEQPADEERAELLDALAALHMATITVPAPPRPVALPGRADLAAALGKPSSVGGPYADQLRALLTEAAPRIRDLLASFDQLATAASALPKVITHGEPHPGNIVRTATGPILIDWDTVGLAPPERDLWLTGPGGFDRYEAATGYRPDPAALELYRLRWRLDDIAAYLTELRRARYPTADTEIALQTLRSLV
jgi:spectinomycin phosphotransferase